MPGAGGVVLSTKLSGRRRGHLRGAQAVSAWSLELGTKNLVLGARVRGPGTWASALGAQVDGRGSRVSGLGNGRFGLRSKY